MSSKRKKLIQAGTFVILIFVPVFAFLFLYFFGTNHYKIPKYFPLNVISGDTVYHSVPNFLFTDQNGNDFSSDQVEGKYLIIDYFFTSCLGPCPRMSEGMSYIQSRLIDSKAEDIMLLSFTVDPLHDSAQTLNEYAQLYNADYAYWNFLTGEKKDLYQFAREGLKIVAGEGDGGENDFIHTQKFVLIDKNRIIRGYYDGTSQKEITRLLKEIEVLRYEDSLNKDEE